MAERMIQYFVPDTVQGQRADKVFADSFADVSRARLQRAFDSGRVTYKGVIIDKGYKLNGPGKLHASLEELEKGVGPQAVAIPLEIVYEDASIVVVNKAAGMITHPGNGTSEDTLVHALLHHTDGALSSVGSPERPGIVHRLDKETTGLIVVAKTDLAHHRLASAFSERNTYKCYQAFILGVPLLKSGTCREPIGRHPVHRTRMSVQGSGRTAHTEWKVESIYGDQAARVTCVIHTGRTHQIRVHMSHLKHPLLGDISYGFKANRLPEIVVPRVMLHAAELHFPHPETEKKVCLKAPAPADFEILEQRLRASN
ncbi:MAG: Ribosomal large subunit pseudouridine synthase D [Opitutia bacterium UBA7350]|nr:MAG: Ribosomal large subunit pseudouridine synthase D [Opitutae bacterium UBA7350]